jgi:hypothetical protein
LNAYDLVGPMEVAPVFADLNCDDAVNIFDLQILAWHFMNSYS